MESPKWEVTLQKNNILTDVSNCRYTKNMQVCKLAERFQEGENGTWKRKQLRFLPLKQQENY